LGGGELGTDPELSADDTESLSNRLWNWFVFTWLLAWASRRSDGESIDEGDGEGDDDWDEMICCEFRFRLVIFFVLDNNDGLEDLTELLFEFVVLVGLGVNERIEETEGVDNSEEFRLIKLFELLNFEWIEDDEDIPF